MLGDTAVAVHPDDQRYRDAVGRMVKLPLVDREIPVVADEGVARNRNGSVGGVHSVAHRERARLVPHRSGRHHNVAPSPYLFRCVRHVEGNDVDLGSGCAAGVTSANLDVVVPSFKDLGGERGGRTGRRNDRQRWRSIGPVHDPPGEYEVGEPGQHDADGLGPGRADLREELDQTRRQLEERKSIDRAKGLLMSVHQVSEQEAFSTLRKLAMDKHRTLGETARDVIAILEKPGSGKAAT